MWQTLSGARTALFASNGGMIVSVIVLGASVYLFYLLINYLVIKWVRLPA